VTIHNATNSSASPSCISLSTLPPLLLQVVLPPTYPMHDPPQIVSFRATHSWLDRMSALKTLLLEMWQPGAEGVLYRWVEYIRNGEFLQPMELTLTSVDTIRIFHPAPEHLLSILSSHDMQLSRIKFSQMSYPCSICLTTMKGSQCLQLSCSHIFCRDCLSGFWGACIAEGEVGRVGCPDPACVKEKKEASEEDVRKVLDEGEILRWKWLTEKRIFDIGRFFVLVFGHVSIKTCRSDGGSLSEIFLSVCRAQAQGR
jgi:E3 ubiquitin-protein ligase RNF14